MQNFPPITISQYQQFRQILNSELGITNLEIAQRVGQNVAKLAEVITHDLNNLEITILVGTGQKGAQALASAKYLLDKKATVNVVLSQPKEKMAKESIKILTALAFAAPFTVTLDPTNSEIIGKLLSKSALLIDGILDLEHTTKPIPPEMKLLIQLAADSKAAILSIDLASGIHADTGEIIDDLFLTSYATLINTLPRPCFYVPQTRPVMGQCFLSNLKLPLHILPRAGVPNGINLPKEDLYQLD